MCRMGLFRRALFGVLVVLAPVFLAPGVADGVQNPPLPPGCGVDIGFVVDTSGSIIDAGPDTMDLVRRAGADLVRSLAGTPSSVSAWRFAGEPEVVTRRLRLDDADQVEIAAAALGSLHFDDRLIEAGTNWDAALRAVENVSLDVVVLVTDGSPTLSGRRYDEHHSALRGSTEDAALRASVRVADRIKAKGTRIVAVGVGDVAEKGLQAIAGPKRGSDWFAGDFASLGTSLRTVAGALCGSGIVTRVLVDGVERRASTVDIVPAPKGRRVGAVVRDLAPGKYVVTAEAPAGAVLSSVDCDVEGKPYVGQVDYRKGSVEVEVPQRQVASCAFSYTSLALLGRRTQSGCTAPMPPALPIVAGLAALLLAVLRYASRARGAWDGLVGVGTAVAGVAAVAGALRVVLGGAICGVAGAWPGLLGLVLAGAAFLVSRLARRTSAPAGDAERAPRAHVVVLGATVAAVIAVSAVVGAAALAGRGETVRTLRIEGRTVQNAGNALTGLERFVAGRAVAAGGVADERARCYFVRAVGGALADHALCGPIRRADATEPAWDRYDLRVLPQGEGRAYVHVDRLSRVAEEPPTSGLVRPDAAHDIAPPSLPTGSSPAPAARTAPGAVIQADETPPADGVSGRTVDFGSGATVSLRAWSLDQVGTKDGTRSAAAGEHLVALDVDRSDVAAGAALRILDGDRRLDLPAADGFEQTLVVSLQHPDQAVVRVGLQGVEVPLALQELRPMSPVPDTRLSAFTVMDATIPESEVPVRVSPLPGILPARETMFEWVVRGAELTARHPRLGWADAGKAWLVVKVDDFRAPCPAPLLEVRCDVQLADSFTVRDLEGRVYPAVAHARAELPGFTGIDDVVFAVPADLTESVLAVRPTFVWEVAGRAPEQVAFARREVRVRLKQRSADQVLAEQIALSLSDLPGAWRTQPFARPPGVDEAQQRFERCLGRIGMQARETARARSDVFHDTRRDDRQLWAAVSFQRSADDNDADLRALQSDTAVGCVRAGFRAALAPDGTDFGAGHLTFEKRTLPGLDVPQASFRAVVVPDDPELPTIYADLVTVVVGRATIEFSAYDSTAPVPNDVQLAAVRVMIERASTAPSAAT